LKGSSYREKAPDLISSKGRMRELAGTGPFACGKADDIVDPLPGKLGHPPIGALCIFGLANMIALRPV
jgi:hypothetical protein